MSEKLQDDPFLLHVQLTERDEGWCEREMSRRGEEEQGLRCPYLPHYKEKGKNCWVCTLAVHTKRREEKLEDKEGGRRF